jgi:ferrous iron transport protein B
MIIKVALFGNPNTGKSSIFNNLTGANQKVGNFPGITVDRHSAELEINGQRIDLIDFPGTYSLYPSSKDEEIVYQVLTNKNDSDYPDLALVTVDASNLERNLFLFSQIQDLGIPTVLIINMLDIAKRKNIDINIEELGKLFPNTPIVQCNPRIKLGIDRLRIAITEKLNISKSSTSAVEYRPAAKTDFESQKKENHARSQQIQKLVPFCMSQNFSVDAGKTNKIDTILLHPFFGYLILFSVLFGVFQLIYSFASIPMDLIDSGFGFLASWSKSILPEGILSDLLTEAIIPGLGGVLIFVPQIALLFFFLSLMEESGYMARVVFLFDRIMKPFGMAGRSVVPLMSSVACAIPGIMSARTIANSKERLITILVAPLMSCSARIPVFTILIALVIPKTYVLGVFNMQGLVMLALYLMGIVFALIVAWVLHKLFKTKEKSFLLLELPTYKAPRWANIGIDLLLKVKSFCFDAGKIILAISILLWFLASFGWKNEIQDAVNKIPKPLNNTQIEMYDQEVASVKLENSYMGKLGKAIEPVIQPLGYDWKIGISLIASFAAREVFVGSLATIYSVNEDKQISLINKMRAEKYSLTHKPVWTLATGLSLMVFYVFAMQCMATLGVVKRETKTWKWPLLQTLYLGVLAYGMAFATFKFFS